MICVVWAHPFTLIVQAKEMVAISKSISAKIKEKQGDITEDEVINFLLKFLLQWFQLASARCCCWLSWLVFLAAVCFPVKCCFIPWHWVLLAVQTMRFKSYLLSLGIDDPVTRESHGTGDTYLRELAKQISDVMETPLKVCLCSDTFQFPSCALIRWHVDSHRVW